MCMSTEEVYALLISIKRKVLGERKANGGVDGTTRPRDTYHQVIRAFSADGLGKII